MITDSVCSNPIRRRAELVLTALHPGAPSSRRGRDRWTLQVSLDLTVTAAPTAAELTALRGMRTVGSRLR